MGTAGFSLASWLSLLLVSVGAACGSANRVVRDDRSGRWIAVHFVEASLTSTRPDGRPWHVSRSGDGGLALVGGLIGLAVGDPATGFALGSALSDPGRTLDRLRAAGMKASVTRRSRIAFGPVLRGRERWLRQRGLLSPTDENEDLVVVRAELPV